MTVALVPPRYGPQVVGGSEAVSREIALGLAGRGWDVEVLTTCAISHYGWPNALPAGLSHEAGVRIHRFPMVHRARRSALRAQMAIQEGRIPPMDEQVNWLSLQFTVPALFEHLLRFGDRYDAVVFSPYMFWTTSVCMPAVAERAVVMPCLHDETYARLDVLRPVLSDPAAVWFLSEPEHQLAHRLGPVAERHQVTGAGVTVPTGYDAEGFRRRHGLERPFVLFAGRREQDKGWPWLRDVYAEVVRGHGLEVDLVTIGVGEVEPVPGLEQRIIDLGFLDDNERNNAFAAAAAYVQPSRMESFSRTIMESWLAGTPVLALETSEVVAWHCRQSGGGRTFADGEGLADALRWVADRPEEAGAAAEAGRRYVIDNYAWDRVLDRMEVDLHGF
jgi:glycosyltransferase involved in cell wall biosynthesis